MVMNNAIFVDNVDHRALGSTMLSILAIICRREASVFDINHLLPIINHYHYHYLQLYNHIFDH